MLLAIGTGGVLPSLERRLPCYLLFEDGHYVVLDIGEASQYRLLRYVKPNKPLMILVSHLHADHVLGLPGFLASLAALGREKPVYIIGPVGIKSFVSSFYAYPTAYLPRAYILEASPGDVFFFGPFVISIALGKHTITNYAYRIDVPKRPRLIKEKVSRLPARLRKKLAEGEAIEFLGEKIYPREVSERREGKSVVYTGDTRPTLSIIELSRGASVLIHDSTYTEKYKRLAVSRGHSTAQEAAEAALIANVKRLALVHLSKRVSEEEILEEARSVFENSFIPSDLEEIVY